MNSKAAIFAIAVGALGAFGALPIAHATPAQAEDRGLLGVGRMFDNDAIGDGHDRWRSGSYQLSFVTGPGWDGTLPSRPFVLREYRLSAQIITPASLTNPTATDRRYAGILSFGMHTHFALGKAEASAGIDLDMTGPQTGIGRFQRNIHKLLGLTEPTVLGNQIGNAVYPTLTAELGRSFQLGPQVTVRPFVEAEAGLETLVRAGGDVVIGNFGQGDMLVRDAVTGQRYRSIRNNRTGGLSFVVGGDVAHVASSHLLPSGGGAPLEPTRKRLRAGFNWQNSQMSAFYGVTWLSREFTTQPEGQVVGSLHISLRF